MIRMTAAKFQTVFQLPTCSNYSFTKKKTVFIGLSFYQNHKRAGTIAVLRIELND